MTRNMDKRVETFSRGLAQRFSRRGFMGRLGAVGIGLAAGGVGEGILASPALAAPCTGTKSIACGNLYGTNQCPGNACTCGFWYEEGPCGANNIWADCCGECNGGGNCRCILINGVNRPTCCNPREYTQGCQPQPEAYINCRVWNCG